LEPLKKLQQDWELPNHQSVISRLIESQEKLTELGKQLLEAKNQINQLHTEKEAMSQVQAQSQQMTATPSDLEAMIKRMVSEEIQQALSNLPVQSNESKPTTQAIAKEPVPIDWGGMSDAELWGTKIKGASEEKIRRSFEAVCLYNDTLATGDNDRLAITNQALRELSGVNGLLVGDWIKTHTDEIVSHNSKYGMQNAKDPSKTETYYNKRHGQENITKILNQIEERFLKKETSDSQQDK
jgi:hypothetical protein